MGRHAKSAKSIWLSGNPSKLSKDEIARRETETESTATGTVIAGRPRVPAHLSADALPLWKEVVRLLRHKGTLTKTDSATIEIYCETKLTWIRAKKEVEEKGLLIQEQRFSKSGDPYTVTIPNPALKIKSENERLLLALAKSLGLAPDHRDKVKQARPKTGAKTLPPKGSVGELLLLMKREPDEEGEEDESDITE